MITTATTITNQMNSRKTRIAANSYASIITDDGAGRNDSE